MFTEEPIDSNRTTQFSRPREYSTYKGFIFVANSVNKDYENPGNSRCRSGGNGGCSGGYIPKKAAGADVTQSHHPAASL